jgi:hypothetical protein
VIQALLAHTGLAQEQQRMHHRRLHAQGRNGVGLEYSQPIYPATNSAAGTTAGTAGTARGADVTSDFRNDEQDDNNALPAPYYIEFGVEDGRECNSRLLREQHGWHGLMMDGGNEWWSYK